MTFKYKFSSDWENSLAEHYGLGLIDFCNILNTIPNEKETREIAAARSEENSKGQEVHRIEYWIAWSGCDAENGALCGIFSPHDRKIWAGGSGGAGKKGLAEKANDGVKYKKIAAQENFDKF